MGIFSLQDNIKSKNPNFSMCLQASFCFICYCSSLGSQMCLQQNNKDKTIRSIISFEMILADADFDQLYCTFIQQNPLVSIWI